MPDYHVAWWNLENLFDIENSSRRTEHLNEVIKNELDNWDQTVLNKKISQLSEIIIKMNNSQGPDILGVCEVENKYVMDKLVSALSPLGRQYRVAHHDCSDKRGIDVAFIYDETKFSFKGDGFHIILKRTATRDLYQVNLESTNGNELILIGNHWPARTGGVLETEPYRIIAGETLAYWNVQLLNEKGEKTPILIMGDFNDDPFSRAMMNYALSTNNTKKVLKATETPRMYNLMWPIMGQGIGSFYYNNFPYVYDQFLVSKGFLVDNAVFSADLNSVIIEKHPEMIKPESEYEVPRKFGRPTREFDIDGFSDHYPISVKIIEA